MRTRNGNVEWAAPTAVVAARLHVEQLQQAGLGTRQICEQTGVARTALQRLMHGRDRVRPDTVDKLLRLEKYRLGPGQKIDATETWQRINALLEAGYTKQWIASQLTGGRALQIAKDLVTVRNAEKIAHIYSRFIGIPPQRSHTLCCLNVRSEPCSWTPASPWFCPGCGYAQHQCPSS